MIIAGPQRRHLYYTGLDALQGIHAIAVSVVEPPTLQDIYDLLIEMRDGCCVQIQDLHDEAFGTWIFDNVAMTLTLKRVNGDVLQVFDLTETNATINPILTRTPQ